MPAQILLIEDEPLIRENVSAMLSLKGYKVATAPNGREGITQAVLCTPDLILCDIMMPEMDGYQVLDTIRSSRSSLATTPFIFLTARTEEMDVRRGMIVGADDYMTKPFKIENLLLTIESRLQREALRKADLQSRLTELRRTVSNLSNHELSTPLTGIIALARILIDQYQELDEEETLSLVELINQCSLRLKRSLDNLRLIEELQQIESSNPAFNHFINGSTELSAELVESQFFQVASRHDRQLNHHIDVEGAALGISEANLQICLDELIDNAFKFSDPGQTIWLGGEMDKAGYRLTVTNIGQPFKPEDQVRIAPFTQFDRAKYEQQGFGLGLSIVKKIVELNNGRLEIESPVIEKTVAAIWIPRLA